MWSAEQEAEIARERAIDLVLQILRSPAFLAHSTEEQKVVLDQIISYGDLSERDIHNLIQEESHRQQLAQRAVTAQKQAYRPVKNYDYLTNLPYDVFVKLVDTGQIKGRDLVSLCDSSVKLREMCMKDRQYTNKDGSVYKTDTQYIYRKLLADERIPVPPNTNPLDIYKLLSRSYRYSSTGIPVDRQPLNTAVAIYAKQMSTGNGHTVILDSVGRVVINVWGATHSRGLDITGFHLVKGLKNIVQVSAGVSKSAVLDNNGDVWINNYVLEDFRKFDPARALGQRVSNSKFRQVEVGNELYLLDVNSNLYKKEATMSVYENGHIQSLASNVKTFKLDISALADSLVGLSLAFQNRIFYHLAAITNSNEILVITHNAQSVKFKIPGVVPKKVVPVQSRILILAEDGNLYIYDEAIVKSTGQQIIRRITENVAQIDATKIIDIAGSNSIGLAVNDNGDLFEINLQHPSENNAYHNGQQYLLLRQIPNITNVAMVSMLNYHVDLLQRFF